MIARATTLDPLAALLLSPAHLALVERVDALVEQTIGPRAARWDASSEAPWEDIQAVHAEGWLLANLAREYGGLGWGSAGADPLAFYLLVERLARGSPPTAHCVQVHNHALQMVSALSTAEQRERWLAPTRERAALLVGVGAEPVGAPPTTAARVEGGYRVRGTKHYATNATLAEWIWTVAIAEESGERLMLLVHKDTAGLEIDSSVWSPTGMRSCVSPTLRLDDCVIPDEDVLGPPGAWIEGHWLAVFNLGFAANYLGSAQGMYDWLVAYARSRPGVGDPFRQAEVGELKTRLDAARLLLYHTALLFKQDHERALLGSLQAKWITQDTLNRIIEVGGDVAGSTAMFREYPLERFYRDMHLHATHSRQIVSAQVVGASELGAEYHIDRQR